MRVRKAAPRGGTGGTAHLAVFPSAGDQRTNDTRFPTSPGDGDAPHLPSVTNYPGPLYHPRAGPRLMSYSRVRGISSREGERDGEERRKNQGRLQRGDENKRERKLLDYLEHNNMAKIIFLRYENSDN